MVETISMTVIELDLEERFSKKIGMGSIAKILFSELKDYDEAILDFKNIQFISRSFAQEYVYHKNNSKVHIIEKNMFDFIKGLLEVVEKDYENTFLN